MPPGPTAPCSLAGLLAVFRPCFTAPTFQTFVGLVVGLIAQTRRRTVCGRLTGAGLDQVWHHSRAHRLFTNARWSGDALGLALADLIVARLLPAGAALTIAVDDTLFKRSGKKVWGGVASRRRREGPRQSPGHPEPAGDSSILDVAVFGTSLRCTAPASPWTPPALRFDQRTVRHPPLTQDKDRFSPTSITTEASWCGRNRPTSAGNGRLTWPCRNNRLHAVCHTTSSRQAASDPARPAAQMWSRRSRSPAAYRLQGRPSTPTMGIYLRRRLQSRSQG